MAHSTTILGQTLKLISRSQIEALDKVHGTDRPHRGLSRWSQFGALVFAQLAGRHSLRNVAYALASQAATPEALDSCQGQCPAPHGVVSSALCNTLHPV